MANKGSPAKIAYDKEYNARPEEKKKRAERNKARREAIAEGKAAKGDGKDVDHIKPMRKGGDNSTGTRVVDEKVNKGWRKGKKGYDN